MYYYDVFSIQDFVRMKKAIQSGLYNCGLFTNTHFISTSILRSAGESLSAYESRCFVTSARWLLDHLRGVAPMKILTDETERRVHGLLCDRRVLFR